MNELERMDETTRAQFEAEADELDAVMSELEGWWDGFNAALVKMTGRDPEAIGTFLWLKLATEAVYAQMGALHGRNGVSHPMLSSNFRELNRDREHAIEMARKLLGGPNTSGSFAYGKTH
ncbi:hypothetical protein [Solimonas terrae]|uniref:Uncharacterized protein n=1 Tax=Solimonas terrae TaxID=1396819 RepID=A0A6M2BSM2_9GAMM|nr:hypothetical protein [Solimonas terrae]NGY05354.1 hypothetical protein [Solimonas terrae]